MYHIAVISSNQEETALLARVRSAFALKRSPLQFFYLSSLSPFQEFLLHQKPDYIFLSTEFTPSQQYAYISALASHIKQSRRLIPLVYLIDWKKPVSAVLGTNWSQQVGILHTHTNQAEIIDQFQRLDGWGVTVGQ
jgi:hypothetical protein